MDMVHSPVDKYNTGEAGDHWLCWCKIDRVSKVISFYLWYDKSGIMNVFKMVHNFNDISAIILPKTENYGIAHKE